MKRTRYFSTHYFSAQVGSKHCKWCGRSKDVHPQARIRRAAAEIGHAR